jgi:FimV-like protein
MIRLLALMVLILFFSVHSPAMAQYGDLTSEEIEELLEVAAEKFDKGDEEESVELFLKVLEADSINYDALWNISILYSRMGFRLDRESEMKEYFEKAKKHAEKAKEYHPDKGRPYYVYAVALGRMTDLMSTRDRIRAAHDIEENVKKAAEIEPDYAPVWHLYGVWHSDVANVSRVERIAARFISKGLPRGSSEKAEEFLKKAIQMDENRILFRMDLARHYIEVGEKEKAGKVLENILKMEARTKDDPGNLEAAKEMLGKLS